MGYAWNVRVRMTPRDGPAEEINLSTVFGSTLLVMADIRYRPEFERRETINRRARPLRFGIVPEVRLRFELTDYVNHHPTIAKIVRRLLDPYWIVELSLDAGTTYREVWLRDDPGPDALGGKTVAGGRHELRLVVSEPVNNYPDIRSGTSW